MSFVLDAVDSKIRMLVDNAFSQGVLSSSGHAGPRYVPQRSTDWRTTTRWLSDSSGEQFLESDQVPQNAPINCLAVAGHNLGAIGAEARLQYHDGTAWQDAHAPVSPPDNSPFVVLFSDRQHDRWRLLIDAQEPASISVLAAGDTLEFPEGARPPIEPANLNPEAEMLGGPTEGGEIPGMGVIRKGHRQQLSLDLLDPRWVRDTWQPIRERLLGQGVFLFWNYENFSEDVIFGNLFSASVSQTAWYNELDLEIRGKA